MLKQVKEWWRNLNKVDYPKTFRIRELVDGQFAPEKMLIPVVGRFDHRSGRA